MGTLRTPGPRWRTAVHGMPRIGQGRALKWALERYWAAGGEADRDGRALALVEVAAGIRAASWRSMQAAGIDFACSNDFSLYDHVLDTAVMLGAVPERFRALPPGLDRYFAMARGAEGARSPARGTGGSIAPLALTKWFDTNYHHLVPELPAAAQLLADPSKPLGELAESAGLGVATTPVLLGPFSFLARSRGAGPGHLAALPRLYSGIVAELGRAGAEWARLEEPALVEDRSPAELAAIEGCYRAIAEAPGRPKIALITYFGHVGEAMPVLARLPVEGVGLDFCRGSENRGLLEAAGGLPGKVLFAGVVDGRNVWRNELSASLDLLERLAHLAAEVVVSTSCSLQHVPLSLDAEPDGLPPEVRSWLAFAEEKLGELSVLARGAAGGRSAVAAEVEENADALARRRASSLVHSPAVRRSLAELAGTARRSASPEERHAAQAALGLPLLATTTIGSFPQTPELRAARAALRSGALREDEYRDELRAEVERIVRLQEEIGLDVLVHGEPERDDMVRWFAAQLDGFALTEQGWVQSYGSRCVRPPICFGDVSRPAPMTLEWATYAQSLTDRPVKGMLTGPVTMVTWSFVRDDQPVADTARQVALAMRDELVDLQDAGVRIVQVDEAALREGMPLREGERAAYLQWATRAFRVVSAAAAAGTQVHTHMCYSELGDVLGALDRMDVDVVSLEAARSKMALVGALGTSGYGGGVGPGVYDVHSPHVPDVAATEDLLRRALEAVGARRLWVNPDCGLKTRRYGEVVPALRNMVAATRRLRAEAAGQEGTGGEDGT